MTDAAQVPLHELLREVPADARMVIDDADGMGTQYIPVGRYCHEAADELERLTERAERAEAERDALALQLKMRPAPMADCPVYCKTAVDLQAERDALRAEINQQAEPVATVTRRMKADGSTHKVATLHVNVDLPEGTSLYASPQPQSRIYTDAEELIADLKAEPVAYCNEGDIDTLHNDKWSCIEVSAYKVQGSQNVPLYTAPPPRITTEQVAELKRLADEVEDSTRKVVEAEYATMGDPSLKYKMQQFYDDRAALHAALDALVKETP